MTNPGTQERNVMIGLGLLVVFLGGMVIYSIYYVSVISNIQEIRIDEHDQEIKENNNLIGAIKELATEVKYMRADLNDTIERLNKLEGKDSDKWEKFKWLLVAGLVTIVLGSLAVQVGLK